MTFLDWFNDPDVAGERREIRQLLRCTEDEAVKHQEIARLAEAVEVLASQSFVPTDDSDEDEPQET